MLRVPIVLLAAGDADLRNTIADQLRGDDVLILSAYDPTVAFEAAVHNRLAAAVIDLTHEVATGMETTKRLHDLPPEQRPLLIALTADALHRTMLEGEGVVIDEWITAPFTWPEVHLRLRRLFNRTRYGHRVPGHVARRASEAEWESTNERILVAGDLRIDVDRCEVLRSGRPVELRWARLFDLLVYLVRHEGKVFTVGELLTHVWGYVPATVGNTVQVHIHWLREAIEHDPSHPQLIQTVHRTCYRFVAAPVDAAAL